MSWTTPKTNWTTSDTFNISDFNRIKNNLQYVYENSQMIFGEYDIIDMGADVESVAVMWDVAVFNAFESNMDTINQHMLNYDLGVKKTFYANGVFITYDELNRLESGTELLKNIIDGWIEGMAMLPFRLGAKRAIKE